LRVSFITVCRNAAEEIGDTLRSISAQSHPTLQQVIVDGASTDGTLTEVERLALPGVTVVSERDAGIYDAMNKGIGLAIGDLICFLNAGDTLIDSEVTADVVRFFELNPDVDVAYGGLRVIDVDGACHDFMPPPAELALDELVRGCLPHQATFARPKVFERTQGFDLSYRIHADHDWFVKVAFAPDIKLARIERTIATFKLGGTSSRLEESQPEFYAIQNRAEGYQSQTWLSRRIEILQARVLDERLAHERLKTELRALRAPQEAAREVVGPASLAKSHRPVSAVWDRKLAGVRDRRS
jgi:glycosyltransferase involved in cell wall biosynthesis